MNTISIHLFKQFRELIPGADPLLVGTVTATTGTSTTLETPGGGVVIVRGGGVAIGQKAFYQGGAIIGPVPDLPTYEIEV